MLENTLEYTALKLPATVFVKPNKHAKSTTLEHAYIL